MSQNLVIVVLGRKGSGKTSLVNEIIKEHPRVFVIDSLAEYEHGFTVVEGKNDCIDAMLSVKGARHFRLSLRTLDVQDNLDLMGLAYQFPKTLLVVEETSLYTKAGFLPVEIAQLIRYGRHREIDQIYIARRPSEISRDLTAQADLIVSFEQREPRDVKFLRDVAGSRAEAVQHLEKYKVIAFGDLDRMPLAVMARIDRRNQNRIDPLDEMEENPG